MKKYSVSPPNFLLSAEAHMPVYQQIYNSYLKYSHLNKKNDIIESRLYILHIVFLLMITISSIMISMYLSVLIIFVILFMFSGKYNRSIHILFSSYHQKLLIEGQYQSIQQQVLQYNFQKSHLSFLDSLIYQAKYNNSNEEEKLSHIKKIIDICFSEKNPEYILQQLNEDYIYIQEFIYKHNSLLKNNYQTKPYYLIQPLLKK